MAFEIPSKLDLSKQGQTTLIRAREALERHEPDKAARLLQRAKIKRRDSEMARDLLLVDTLSHCNFPGKAFQTVINAIMRHTMTAQQRLLHQIVEGELLATLGMVKQAAGILAGAVETAVSLERTDLAAEALILEGMVQSMLGDQQAALSRMDRGISLAEEAGLKRLLARGWAEKAVSLHRRGELGASLEAAREAVACAPRNDHLGRALGYRQIGVVHGTLFRFFESLEAHRNALKGFNEMAYVPGQLRTYLSLADTYIDMGDIGLATHFANSARLLAEDGDNPIMEGLVQERLGRLGLASGEVQTAIGHFETARKIAEQQESDIFLAASEQSLGIAKTFAGNFSSAFAHLHTAARRFAARGQQRDALLTRMDMHQIAPFLDDAEQHQLDELDASVGETARLEMETQPVARAKQHFVDAYRAVSAHQWAEAISHHDDGVEILAKSGGYLAQVFALHQFGKRLLIQQNQALACDILERGLKTADVYGFPGLSKLILETLGNVDGQGEDIVVEYSLDKAAVRQLGDEADLQGSARRAMATNIIGDSPKLVEVLEEVERFAPTDLPVLILGESGTGKELVARRIHELSNRAAKPFVAVNCATLPAGIIDAELFGAKKGAYSALTRDRQGLIVEANRGTLFLDELGDLPIELQSKLLRFLQEGEVRPLGSDKTYTVDVRVVAATNVDLHQAMTDGLFREDLFYRLGVVTLVLPPLADRGRDIVAIARHLIEQDPFARQKGVADLSRAAAAMLLSHDWPGNIRELANVIQTAIVRTKSAKITTDDLKLNPMLQPPRLVPEPLSQTPDKPATLRSRDEVMRESVLKALEITGGNQSEAAHLLNIHRNTLRNWIKKMKDEPE